MAGNQELMQAFQIWQDAIGQKNAQDALFQSTKLAEQIQGSNIKQYEKEQQLKGLGNNLAAFLAQQGQSGQAAALAANAITGRGPDKITSLESAQLNRESLSPEQIAAVDKYQEQKRADEAAQEERKTKTAMAMLGARQAGAERLKDKDIASREGVAKIKLTAQEEKSANQLQSLYTGRYSTAIKDIAKAKEAAGQVIKMLDSGDTAGLTGPIKNILTTATGSKGTQTEGDIERVSGLESFYRTLEQSVVSGTVGGFSDANKAKLRELAVMLRDSADERKGEALNMYAHQLGEHTYFKDIPYDQIVTKFVVKEGIGSEPSAEPVQAPKKDKTKFFTPYGG